jgi:hypothetical protein
MEHAEVACTGREGMKDLNAVVGILEVVERNGLVVVVQASLLAVRGYGLENLL